MIKNSSPGINIKYSVPRLEASGWRLEERVGKKAEVTER